MDTVFLALRVIVSLAAVFGALFFLHRYVTKGRGAGKSRSRTINVVAKQGLGGKSGIAIVETGDRRYLIGVTDHAVTVLDRLDGADLALAGTSVVEQTVVSLVTGPVQRPSFEHELAAAAGAVGSAVPETPAPFGPGSATHSLQPVFAVQTHTSSLPVVQQPATVVIPAGAAPQSRREARAAQAAQAAQTPKSPIAGSILSPETWRQTAAVLRGQR